MDKELKHIFKIASDFVAEHLKQNISSICVMAPYFENAKEGYLQRVQAIDASVLKDYACIHIDFETKTKTPIAKRIDNRHLLLGLLPKNKQNIYLAKKVAKLCKIMYIHSVMRAMQDVIGDDVKKLFSVKGVYKIWDVHGAVPEEYVLQKNFYEAQNATAAEELMLKNADCIVVISEAMKKHFENKYNCVLKNVINTSVFNITQVDFNSVLKYKSDNKQYIAAYAGNVMPWQNIPLLQQVIINSGEKYKYNIFVSDVKGFFEIANDKAMPKTCTVDCKSPSQVLEQYNYCNFGFVLRDDIAVNNVACPTKLMEYLQFGLIPVLKTPNIGDFTQLGLQYISYSDFADLNLQFDEYIKIITHNNKILQKLQEIHNQGVQKLKSTIQQNVKGK